MNTSPAVEMPVAANHSVQALPPVGHPSPRRTWPRVLGLGGVAALALAAALVTGTLPRLRQQQAVDGWSKVFAFLGKQLAK